MNQTVIKSNDGENSKFEYVETPKIDRTGFFEEKISTQNKYILSANSMRPVFGSNDDNDVSSNKIGLLASQYSFT